MRWGHWVGRKSTLIIAIHNGETPLDSEWEGYCVLLENVLKKDPDRLYALNVTLGGAPNANQRQRVNATPGISMPKGSVFTESAIVRGVITALQWATGGRLKAFRFRDLPIGLAHCLVEPDEVPMLIGELTALGEGIAGGNPMLVALAAGK